MRKNWHHTRSIGRQLYPFLKPYRWGLLLSFVMILLSNLSLALSPTIEGLIVSTLTDNAMDILHKIPGAAVNFHRIIQIISVLVVIYLIKTISQVISVFTLTQSIQSSMSDLRNALLLKIKKLPIRYFDENQYGDILSRITNDVDTVSNALQQTLPQIIATFLSITFAYVMMYLINALMATIVLILVPLALLITRIIVKKSQQRFQQQQDSLGELNGFITEMYTGHRELLVYNQQEIAVNRFYRICDKLKNNAHKAQFMSSMISPLITLVTYFLLGITGVLGGLLAIQGYIKIGQIQAFARYIWQVNDPITQVSNLSSQMQAAFAALKRITDTLQEPEEVTIENPKTIPEIKGDVTISNAVFGYGDTPILKGIDIHVKSGQTIAVVGPTGSGKTTLINLLMRFYDLDEGSICIDGVDIRDMDREYLRSLFAMVLQDTWLINGSIYDNIHYGKLDARKDEVIEAAKLAKVHHFIRTLPEGYNHIISEDGTNISQGEKQLMTIARAILKNPRILILDEATSSVDTRIEKILQDAMDNVMKGRTSFVIAHRLSTIKNADIILVMKDGKILEQGNHQQLLKEKGFYAQLYNSQFSE